MTLPQTGHRPTRSDTERHSEVLRVVLQTGKLRDMTKRRQFGNVYQLRSGRWQARYRTKEGTFRNAPETFESKAKGGAWLAKEQADLDRGVWIDPNASKGITLNEYVERWLTQGRARRYQPRTLEFNTSLLRLYVTPTLGKLELAKIRRRDVARWYEAIATPGQAVKATGSCERS